MGEQKIEILQVSTAIMKFLRILPKRGHRRTKSEQIVLLLALMNFSVIIFIILLHLVHHTSRRTIGLEEVIEDITSLFTATGSLLIVSYISFNSGAILTFFDRLRDFGEFSLPQDAEKSNRVVNVITILWSGFGVVGSLLYYTLRMKFDDACEVYNRKFNRTGMICGMVAPTWLPFQFEHAWVVRLIEMNSFTPSITAACSIVIFLIGCSEMIVVRIRHLKKLLKEAGTMENRGGRNAKLRNCVKYHIHITALCEEFNDCFSKYYFLYFMQNSPLISMISFNFIIDPKIPTAVNFAGWSIGLWLTCTSGQRLIDQSSSISDVTYATDWYDADVSLQKTIQLIILRANKPLHHRAWVCGVSSHVTFTQILKTSYSLIALLNTMYNN